MSDYWKDKKILVTGGSGFLGSFVCKKLQERGCKEVIAPRSAEFNLTRQCHIRQMFERYSPNAVIHLAANVGGIGKNQAMPGRLFYDNAFMGIELMEQARLHNVEKFIATGTICAYPKFSPIPFREANLWDGYPEETNAPYGLAKKMMLVQAQSYRQEYGFNAIYLLPVNLYGPRDNFDLDTSHVIPALIRKCIEAKEKGEPSISLWGDGSASREFLYVEEAAEAILLATEHYNGPQPTNLGSGREITIKELIQLIAKETRYTGRLEWDTGKPNGQPRRCLDTSLAKELFNFASTMTLEDGLKRTIAWYLTNREGGALQNPLQKQSVG